MSNEPDVEMPREPADADRPPVSRVGDELQQRAEGRPAEVGESEAEDIEREAFDVAQEKGWDKSVKDDGKS